MSASLGPYGETRRRRAPQVASTAFTATAWRILRVDPGALAGEARTEVETALLQLEVAAQARPFAGMEGPLVDASARAERAGVGHAFRRWQARLVAAALEPRLGPFFTLPQTWKPYWMAQPEADLRGTISTDRLGFRVTHTREGRLAYDAFSADRSTPRGVLLGNSSVFGAGLDDAETLASRLSRSGRASWFNLGLPSSNLLQERLVVDAYLPDGLDAVALVSGVNSLVYTVFADRFDPHAPEFERRHSFDRLCNGTPPNDFSYPFPEVSVAERERRLAWLIEHMRRGVRSLALECRARGTRRVGFFLQPILAWTGKVRTPEEVAVESAAADALDFFFRALDHPFTVRAHTEWSGALARACGDAGIDFFDLNRDPKLCDAGPTFCDPIHWTEAATDQIAERVDAWSRA